MSKLLALLVMTLALTGCIATKPVYVDRPVFIEPPALAMTVVKPVAPPRYSELDSLDVYDREVLLMEKITEMQDALFNHDIHSKALHNWVKEQKQIFPTGKK